MANELVNIALNKPAQQSSANSPNENTPQRAVDGRSRAVVAFHTGRERNPWWQVDLGLPYPIEKIVVYNIPGEYGIRTANFAISGSLDGETFSPIYAAISQFGGYEDNAPLVVNPNGQVVAQFIRCSVRGRNFLHLSQVEIYVKAEHVMAAHALSMARVDVAGYFEGLSQRHGSIEFKPATRPTISALKIRRLGRFGNCVVCLTNAIAVAQAMELDRIYFDGSLLGKELDLEQATANSNIQILPHTDPSLEEICHLSGSFFKLHAFPQIRDALSQKERRALARRFIFPMLARELAEGSSLGKGVTVIHLRSGDVIRAGVAYGYLQPPLAFYKVVLERAMKEGCRRVILVAENDANPVINPLVEWCNGQSLEVTISMSDFLTDLRVLMRARRVVASNSTLMEALILVSSHLRSMTFFQDPYLAGIARDCGLGVRHLQDLGAGTEKGYHLTLGSWQDTPEQRQLMLSFSREQLAWEAEPTEISEEPANGSA